MNNEAAENTLGLLDRLAKVIDRLPIEVGGPLYRSLETTATDFARMAKLNVQIRSLYEAAAQRFAQTSALKEALLKGALAAQ